MKPLAVDLFVAYVITCRSNGKSYVGITSRSFDRRWIEHVSDAANKATPTCFGRAILKHGADQFTATVVASARSWDAICAAERALIAQWRTKAPHGYNTTDGGEGVFGYDRTAEQIERSAAKHRGRPCHPNTRAAAVRTHRGRPKSREHCDKIARARKGTHRSPETKAKLAAYWAGRRQSGAFKTARPYEHARKTAGADA